MPQDESGTIRNTQPMVALGSNADAIMGGAQAVVLAALEALECQEITVLATSKLYHTPCFPAGNGPDFVNAVALIQSELTPAQILQRLHEIEADFGRKRSKRWGPRTLDLDLICVGGQVLPDRKTVQGWIDVPLEEQMTQAPEQLILPHPRLQDRGFVLIPLADVAPGWIHPILNKSVQEMINSLPEAEKSAIQALD